MLDGLKLKSVIRCMLIMILIGDISLFLGAFFILGDSEQANNIARIVLLLPPLIFIIYYYVSWTHRHSVYTLPVSITVFFVLGVIIFIVDWLANYGKGGAGIPGLAIMGVTLPLLIVTFVISKFIAHRRQQDINSQHYDSGENSTDK